jgi:hypothetical protein
MSKFRFTGPDGKVYDIQGPPGATAAQAQAVFDRQLNSGALVGLSSGDVVSAVTQAGNGLRSAVSQVGGPQGLKLPATRFDLSTVPVQSGINAADFAKQRTPNFSLGALEPTDLRALLAQTAAQTDQAVNAVDATKGIGKFGLDIDRLEATGYVKPGTAQAYTRMPTPSVTAEDIAEAEKINSEGGDITPEQVSKNRQLNTFLSPAVFTGKAGATNLKSVLSDDRVQDTIQGDVLKQSFQKLSQLGGDVSEQLKNPTQLSAALQTAAKFGVKTAENLVKGLDVANIAEVKSVARAAEFAKSLAGKFAESPVAKSPLETSVLTPRGSTNTVNRSTVNASIISILGNSKIPSPSFIPKASATSTADDVALTYTGNDPIVWDRVNAARIRDGLPGLDEIGLPRPE